MRLPLALLVAASLPCFAEARAETVRLEPSADNTLFEDAEGDTSSGAGPALFVGMNNQNGGRARRALIAFDVASSVPPGARVDSVVLELHVSNSSDLVPRILTVHRVTSPWGEGRSVSSGGTGTDASLGDATWLFAFFPDRAWRTIGGDFEPLESALQVAGAIGSCAWSGSGLVSDVQSWLRQPASNCGWLVVGDESDAGTARRFDSRENPDPAMRPSLTIHFSPARSARAATWGSIKAAYR